MPKIKANTKANAKANREPARAARAAREAALVAQQAGKARAKARSRKAAAPVAPVAPEVVYQGQVCPGEHAPILDRPLFEAVQEQLAAQRRASVARRAGSGALLMGKLYDERGSRVSPSQASKRGRRYRYYVVLDPRARPAGGGRSDR